MLCSRRLGRLTTSCLIPPLLQAFLESSSPFLRTKQNLRWHGKVLLSAAGSRARNYVLSQSAEFRHLTPILRALLPAPHPLPPGLLWAPDPGGLRALEAEGVWGRASWETTALLNFPLSNNSADKILGWGRCPPFPQSQPQSELESPAQHPGGPRRHGASPSPA